MLIYRQIIVYQIMVFTCLSNKSKIFTSKSYFLRFSCSCHLCLSSNLSIVWLCYFLSNNSQFSTFSHCSSILVQSSIILFKFQRLDSLLTLASYFYAHLRDPGYIQNDAVFLTQEGVTFSHAVESWFHQKFNLNIIVIARRRSNSLVKLRSRKTRSTTETETHICTTSPEMKDKMVNEI